MWQQNTKVRSLSAAQHPILPGLAQLSWVKEPFDVLSAAGLTLSLGDALAYAEEKGELFGHHARNVYHVATQVSLHFALSSPSSARPAYTTLQALDLQPRSAVALASPCAAGISYGTALSTPFMWLENGNMLWQGHSGRSQGVLSQSETCWFSVLKAEELAGVSGAGCRASRLMGQGRRWEPEMAMEDTLPRRPVSLVDIQVSLSPVPSLSQ